MDEIWKPVVGYEGLYEVSNLGRVWSERRVLFLRQVKDPQGYRRVQLSKKGVKKLRLVHQLVAESFIGPRPKGMLVRHGPNGRQDNSVENLSYGTKRQNNCDDYNRDNVFSSRFPGVSLNKRSGLFEARIQDKGKRYFLGSFTYEAEAASMYQRTREEIENV